MSGHRCTEFVARFFGGCQLLQGMSFICIWCTQAQTVFRIRKYLLDVIVAYALTLGGSWDAVVIYTGLITLPIAGIICIMPVRGIRHGV